MEFAGSPRRALIIVQNLPVPFDRRVWLEATSLTRAGYRISVICPKAKGFNKSFEVQEDIEIYRYSLPFEAQGILGFITEFGWCFFRTFLKSLRIAFWGRGFDVIHACNPPETYWVLGLFWGMFGKSFIFDHHDLSPEMYRVKFQKKAGVIFRLLLWFEKMTFRAAKVVIATNESHKRIAVERGGKFPDEVFVVRSGPDLTRLSVFPSDPSWKNGKKHLIVYLGEICKQDGVDYLVRALKILHETGRRDFYGILVGGGPHQPAIKSYAEEMGIGEICSFTGRVSDQELCRILSSADIAVDPDPKNEWSDKCTMNKIMEYMFFGLPIVAFTLKENSISAESAAVYAEPNLESLFAEKLVLLLDDPVKRAIMSKFGSQRLREHLAWEHSEPNLLLAYDKAFYFHETGQQNKRKSFGKRVVKENPTESSLLDS